ncbi:MAG: hypothetical protein ACHQJD_05055 [Thermoanaerobaculia bacterium]
MRTPASTFAFAFALAAFASPAAAGTGGFGLDVLVNGSPRPELAARGTVYVEALRGHDYALRLSNPTGTRVAVALSVDGLNTIDAKHTSASDARKWVLAPYETVVIPGWQVSNATSRKFVFTGERGSYGAALGKTDDLGVIEAVFFREKTRWRETGRFSANERESAGAARDEERQGEGKDEISSKAGDGGPGAAPPRAEAEANARDHSKKSSSSSPVPALSDEYAATGMGSQTRFGVTRVDLELEKEPAAVVRLRYEFRPQLIALGVLPRDPDSSRIARRERARGFEEFCPEVR